MMNDGESASFQHKRTNIILVLVFMVVQGCDTNYVSPIPPMVVSLNLNLTAQYPTFRNSSGEYLIFNKPVLAADRIGYGGVLVCSGVLKDDFGNTLYYAYDLACPHEAEADIRVAPLTDRLGEVKCAGCGTVYNVGYGFGEPVSGPSKHPLKRYKTYLQGDYLQVFN